MANWKETLNLKDLHDAYRDGTLPVKELANKVHARCMNLKCAGDPIFQDVISMLIDIDDIETYDEALSDIYNYGDIGHRIWVKTL